MTTPLTKLIENGGWRPVEEAKDGYNYITEMKHGIISGGFDARDGTCGGYYWQSLNWFPYKIMETDTPQRMAEVIKVLLGAIKENGKRKGFCDALDGWAALAIQRATAIAEGNTDNSRQGESDGTVGRTFAMPVLW